MGDFEFSIAAIVYADGIYPDRVIAEAIAPLREGGVQLAGALQVEAGSRGRHPCDMLLEDLASGEIHAIAEDRGSQARGCRLDVGLLTEIGDSVLHSLYDDSPALLVVNKFGKVEGDGGGMRQAIVEAVDRGIPVLVGVPARNLDRWRAFVGSLSRELPAEAAAITGWLRDCGIAGLPDVAEWLEGPVRTA
jgi:nucleoside-triphosphatase THEP1